MTAFYATLNVTILQFLIVNGGWSAWGAFGACSKTCGGGEKTRRRMCNNPAPANGGSYCTGQNSNTVPCNTHTCPGKINIRNSIYRISFLLPLLSLERNSY